MKRYRPNTQKSINKFAQKLLSLYRAHRKYDDCNTARWRAYFALCISTSGNINWIIQCRQMDITKKYWRGAK